MIGRHEKSNILGNTKNGHTCRFHLSLELTAHVKYSRAILSLLTSLLDGRHTHLAFAVLVDIEWENHNMADKEATTEGSVESSVEIIKAENYTNTSNPPGDLEKGDFEPSPSKSAEMTITAQDWTGPDDPENPQNW